MMEREVVQVGSIFDEKLPWTRLKEVGRRFYVVAR